MSLQIVSANILISYKDIYMHVLQLKTVSLTNLKAVLRIACHVIWICARSLDEIGGHLVFGAIF